MAKEIERKFILKQGAFAEEIKTAHSSKIQQGYLTDICSLGPVVRVRLKEENGMQIGFLTIKHRGKQGKVLRAADEYEYMIPADDAIELLDKACFNTLFKTRYDIELNGFLWEFDVFEGRHLGIRFAEVEFKSEEDADSFLIPDFVSCEVTNDIRFGNNYLSGAITENIREVIDFVHAKSRFPE